MEPVQKVVADTSAVLAVCLREATRQKIIACTQGAELIAPPSLPLEVPNALSSKFKQGALDLDEALAVIDRFEQIPIQEVPVGLREATELAWEMDIYAYDAYMIAAARRHHCPILTLDGGLIRAARQAGVKCIDLE